MYLSKSSSLISEASIAKWKWKWLLRMRDNKEKSEQKLTITD